VAGLACDLARYCEVHGGLVVIKDARGVMLGESYVGSKLPKEDDVFGAAA
jgi:hypothetical protein